MQRIEDVLTRSRLERLLAESRVVLYSCRTGDWTVSSTLLVPISEDVLVMPIVGALDSRRAEQVMSTLLDGVGKGQARVAILDITGVSVVDTQVADALLRAAEAVALLQGAGRHHGHSLGGCADPGAARGQPGRRGHARHAAGGRRVRHARKNFGGRAGVLSCEKLSPHAPRAIIPGK
jgi:hypothetical protein